MAVDAVLARWPGRAGFTGGALGGGRSARALRSAWSRGSRCAGLPAACRCADVVRAIVRRAGSVMSAVSAVRRTAQIQLILRIMHPPGRSSIARGS